MSNIWKAVTGFFKAKEKMEEEKAKRERVINPNNQEENDEDDGSDSDDEDFVPNEANDGAVSEELSDDDVDDDETTDKRKTDKKNGTSTSSTRRKRKSPKKPTSFLNGRASKRGRFADDDTQSEKLSNDHHADEDDEQEQKSSGSNSEAATASQEAQEKAETDKLWADFLTSVDEEKAKRNSLRKERTIEKVVNKVYDFAGEKVSVQEKVKVTVSSESEAKAKSLSSSSVVRNGNDDDAIASSSSLFLKPDQSPSSSSSPIKSLSKKIIPMISLDREEPQPGPSSAMNRISNGVSPADKNKTSPQKQPERRRKGGISILGNDPELIGLDELDKRGLSGLLKAFKSHHQQSKKIGTLEKSKLDWEAYKRKQGLEEELQNHNRSKDTYIDKQEFLNRTDHRQFEIEKGMRATQRSKRLANN